MNAIDYEAEYNNRVRVPEHPGVMAGWVRDAAAYREKHPPRVLRPELVRWIVIAVGTILTVVYARRYWWT